MEKEDEDEEEEEEVVTLMLRFSDNLHVVVGDTGVGACWWVGMIWSWLVDSR